MSFHRLGMLVTGVLYIATAPLLAHAQGADIPKMTAEISQLSAEQHQISAKLQQSVALKKQDKSQFKRFTQESNSRAMCGSW